MITHEEALKAHCNAIIGQTAEDVDKNHDIVKQYMKQQAKVEELLEAYRKLIDNTSAWDLDWDWHHKVDILENELNDKITAMENEK